MKSQFNKKLSVLMLMTFMPFLMISGVSVQAADKFASCEQAPTTYRSGAPGKGTIRKHDCERVEFSAFEQVPEYSREADSKRGYTVKIGKPSYNRRPKNR